MLIFKYMKTIPLNPSGIALVDDDDYARISKYKWQNKGYAERTHYLGGGRKNKKSMTIFMHREVNRTPKDMYTDHINMNKLDNQKLNLRDCTLSQNNINRLKPNNNTSGYKGVTWARSHNKWKVATSVTIGSTQKRIFVGYFDDKIKAAQAYDATIKKYFGDFALPNIDGRVQPS